MLEREDDLAVKVLLEDRLVGLLGAGLGGRRAADLELHLRELLLQHRVLGAGIGDLGHDEELTTVGVDCGRQRRQLAGGVVAGRGGGGRRTGGVSIVGSGVGSVIAQNGPRTCLGFGGDTFLVQKLGLFSLIFVWTAKTGRSSDICRNRSIYPLSLDSSCSTVDSLIIDNEKKGVLMCIWQK